MIFIGILIGLAGAGPIFLLGCLALIVIRPSGSSAWLFQHDSVYTDETTGQLRPCRHEHRYFDDRWWFAGPASFHFRHWAAPRCYRRALGRRRLVTLDRVFNEFGCWYGFEFGRTGNVRWLTIAVRRHVWTWSR